MPLPSTFPPDTLFAVGKGIPMTRPGEASWSVLRWDTPEPAPISPAFWMFAKELDEAAFRAAVERLESTPEDTPTAPEARGTVAPPSSPQGSP